MERISVIIALLVLWLDVSIGFNGPVAHPSESSPPSSSSPLRVVPTAWATSNDGAAIDCASSSSTSRQRRRGGSGGRRSRAPLVDSALLRFLSTQKRMNGAAVSSSSSSSSVLLPSPPTTAVAGGMIGPTSSRGGGDAPSSEDVVGRAMEGEDGIDVVVPTGPAVEDLENAREEPSQSSAPSASAAALDDSTGHDNAQSSYLFGRYDARGVASKLMALGADADASMTAGDAVQDYASTRITRRRIRRFLRERDAMWGGGGEESGHQYAMTSSLDRDGTMTNDAGSATSPATTAATTDGGGFDDLDDVLGVMTEYGLTGNDVAAVLSHTPGVAMMRARRMTTTTGDGAVRIENGEDDDGGRRSSISLDETLDRSLVGLLGDTLGLRRYDARKVLRSTSGLLTSRGSSNAVQVVRLMIGLGSSANAIARDKSSLPTLLRRSPALIFRLVAFLSSARLRVPLSAIGPMLRQRQGAELLNAVAPVVVGRVPTRASDDASRERDDAAGCGENSLSDEIPIRPTYESKNVMRQRVMIEENYRTMEAVVETLRRDAGIRDFRQILSSHPGAFFLNVTNIREVTSFLGDDVGMTRDDIARVVQAYPALLGHDADKMRDVVEYLLSIEVDADYDLPSILRSFPSTLLLDVEGDMMPVVSFLRDMGVRNVGRFVTRIPPVLGYSVEDDLRPKWDFLREVCQFDYFEVVRFPAYFSYPLERIIKMRYEYLRDCKGIPIQLARVDDVLRFGDRDFATEIALDDDGGVAFAEFVEGRSIRSRGSRRKKRSFS